MKRTRLRRVNPEYAKELHEYKTKTKPEWLKEHPGCQFEVAPGVLCGITNGVGVHHKMRRKKYLNDKRYLMTACEMPWTKQHHQWIENNKREARARGYILYV